MAVQDAILALTIDVEGLAESHAESVRVPSEFLTAAHNDAEIARNLPVVLDLLAQHECRATFFFLGRIARSAPQLVRAVVAAGHEIACHSLEHRRLTGQPWEAFRTEVRGARKYLEDASGTAVIGYRAPEFSVGRANLWVLDELAEAGFRYDSSVVPTGWHDVYGMPGMPRQVYRWPNGLVEFPLPVMSILGVKVPMGGGGYFRLFPWRWTRRFLRHRLLKSIPTVFYIHPYEIGPEATDLPGLSRLRRFRHYIRLRQGHERFGRLMEGLPFTTAADVLTRAGFLGENASG